MDEGARLLVWGSIAEVLNRKLFISVNQERRWWIKLPLVSLVVLNSIFLEGNKRGEVLGVVKKHLKHYSGQVRDVLYSRFSAFKFWARSFRAKEVVVLFANDRAEGRIQRSHQLVRQFAEKRPVVWIDPVSSAFSPFYSPLEVRRVKLFEGLPVISIRLSKLLQEVFYTSGLASGDAVNFWKTLKRKLFFGKLDQLHVVVTQPFWAEMAGASMLNSLKIAKKVSVYFDCMDLHDGFDSATHELKMYEKLTLQYIPNIVVTSGALEKSIDAKDKNVSLIRNGCAPESFPILDLPAVSQVTVGYFGAVAEWFDIDLLRATAKEMPDIVFEVIGYYGMASFCSELDSLPGNIKFLGEKAFDDLPDLCKNWNVAVIPFKITPLIEATNPVKLYEYSAMGLPCISTPIPEVVLLKDRLDVEIVETVDEFVAAIKKQLESDSFERRSVRREFAEANSWETRAEGFLFDCV